ncbi:esterase B1-like [Phlebotomus papatasi]|uniref:esterase B1-like n=1 Tax=Phlebotomus papatasi TaxID=29031 RepID=UPI00248470C4|nr:esterase B1-like [Phlebotomus papatasi]
MKSEDGTNVIVQPPCGAIRGILEISAFGYEYANFYDIPYAKPPLGPLRFKDPEPLEPWSDLLDASINAPNTLDTQVLNEDCLKLNVYTKYARLEHNPQPVMIFITGGWFLRCPAHKDEVGPEFLLQKDVVLVTFKYRCGALGFLSSDDPEIGVPGNAGLKDQVMALKWVQQNISAFGGDPNNVTIFGCSAGGCSVHYHMLSPLSKDLFHSAVIMSGSAFYPRGLIPKLNWTTRLARKLGWRGRGEASAFQFLRGVDVKTIKAHEENLLTEQEQDNGLTSIYGAVLEAYKSRMCMIPEHPEEMVKHAWSHQIPLMIGGTQNEGLIFYREALENPEVWSKINTTPATLLPYNLTQDPFKRKLYGDKMKQFYFGTEYATVDDMDSYIFLMGDTTYWYPIYKALMSRLRYSQIGVTAPTWLYNFAYESPELYKHRLIPTSGFPGVSHADDLLLLFPNNGGFGIPRKGTPEYHMMQLMVEIYTSFAINGNPNNELLTKIMGEWKPATRTRPTICCNIANPPQIMDLPEKDRVIFWEGLYEDSKGQANTFRRRISEKYSRKNFTWKDIEDIIQKNFPDREIDFQDFPSVKIDRVVIDNSKKLSSNIVESFLPTLILIIVFIIFGLIYLLSIFLK